MTMDDSKPTAGQKRQNSDNSGPATKRAHMSDAEVQIKVLIPASAVGALIGKGGESMRNLKSESGCRVQMSKNQEVYHGTNERICLVKGKVNSCMIVIAAILDRIKEKADNNGQSDAYDLKNFDRTKEMKLVVPNTSAGMVIGKSGSSIKEIRESTGASIQVYPKAGSEEAKVSPERVITVGADSPQILTDAVGKVLEKVAADPLHAQPIDSNSKPNNFAPTTDLNNSQFDFNRGGGQNANQSFGNLAQYPNNSNPVWQSQQSLVSDQGGYGQVKQQQQFPPPKLNPVQSMGNMELLSFLDNLQSTLRTSGFNESSVSEIMAAMQVLARYNIMGLGLGIGVATMAQQRQQDQSIPPPQQPMMQQVPQQQPRYDMGPPMITQGPPGMGYDAGNDHRNDPSLVGNSSGVLIDVMSQKKNGSDSSFASSVIKEIMFADGRMELEVPDVVCGAVLGPKAKTLVEIQQTTNCKVEVHKRGAGNVSSGCRLISLTGDPNAIINGRRMIEKVINVEQSRRIQNGSRGGY
uniref:KH domain-containing protein n=1 Tax=Panagrellus redivivus TaxID=6233 RepID=A0A7E4UYM7_PANRE